MSLLPFFVLASILHLVTADVYPFTDGDEAWDSQVQAINAAISGCGRWINYALQYVADTNEPNLQYIFGDSSLPTENVVASILRDVQWVCAGDGTVVVVWPDESLFFRYNPPTTITTTTTIPGPTPTTKNITVTSPTARCSAIPYSGPYGWIYPGGIVLCPLYFTLRTEEYYCYGDTQDKVLIRYLAAQPPITNNAILLPDNNGGGNELTYWQRPSRLFAQTPVQRLSWPNSYQYYVSNVQLECENGVRSVFEDSDPEGDAYY